MLFFLEKTKAGIDMNLLVFRSQGLCTDPTPALPAWAATAVMAVPGDGTFQRTYN